jgi:hypothetical protein
MSIRDAAYALCKEVGRAPSKKLIGETIQSLGSGNLKYWGHNQFAQFLGYLIVDQERDKFKTGAYPEHIYPLNDEQRQILASAHNQIVELNRQCVSPLVGALPKCAKAVDPYGKYNYRPPTEFIHYDLLTSESTEGVVNSFHGHPQIANAIESSAVVAENVTEEVYTRDVLRLAQEFIESGPLDSPKWFDVITHTESKSASHRTYIRHITALASVRESLITLNQLIYQKLFSEKLFVIDGEYIIKSGYYDVGAGGTAMVFQLGGIFLFMEVSDIILATFAAFDSNTLRLCRVERFEMPLTPGEPAYVELRAIDENLNPFFALARDI